MQYLHTMVRVADIDKSLAFYCGLLGLKEMSRQESERGRYTLIFLAAPGDEDLARERKGLKPETPVKSVEKTIDDAKKR